MLAVAPAYEGSKLFINDLVDATRHYVSSGLDLCVQATITAYAAGNLAAGDAQVTQLTGLALRLDGLLGIQQETLSSWIDEARAYGDTLADKARYVENAKAQVTVWGGKGNLNDYASKAWQGMYARFYLPRWTQFLAALRQSIVTKAPFDQVAFTSAITGWEQAWVKADDVYARHVPADPLADIEALLEASA